MTGHVTATRPQPPSAGSRAGSCDESCARLCVGTFVHGNSPRALGPRALSAALGLLALTATPSLWPAATLSSWPNTLRQPWPMAASVSRRPLAHGTPLATIGYQSVVVIRNGRVIEPIVRGGGHGGRGGLGGMSWWCGGMS